MTQTSAVDALVTLVQLERRAREAQSPEALGFVMVNETLALVPYRQAAFWSDSGLGQVAAVSGLPQVDPNAPYLQWLGRLCRALHQAHTATTPLDAASAPAGQAADWADWLPAHALWLPLTDEAGLREGGLLLARDTPFNEHERAVLAELVHAYAHALAAFRPRRSTAQRFKAALRLNRVRRRILLALLGVCLFPVRLTVLAPAEVVPRDPFLVRAPLDGVVERFFVQPSQAVAAGAPLFSLDTVTLQARRALAQRAYDTAQEEYRQSAQLAVTDDEGRVKLAQSRGELEQKALELEYTTEQLDRVQVKADRAGVAVFDDVNDWQGKAVVVGEKVLLLADPAKVELLAQMPVAEQIPLQPGTVIALYPSADPTRAYEARIVSVAYSAGETDEGVLAYRVRARFEAGAPPRLGLRGTARLPGSWVPFAYYALRRPFAVARQWLGW
ncbi:HlyD family efflux transporter periplasmic adaptor subunit [Chitiniphilus purpureus]|uniref:HlyD family efflux transporter periplasmic adaptor subunit n=1 Tax=Chitiniphilus purpureus TaxID=2981137 RepID=A0ABY6DQD7_9NEIS|nr:HlyD family efflux transporter periplasmic adaptor subunit [Chitiniphilus sp. CD1]UXY15306.1 HlyD family efflux transporter periplasmic adaptor subunit [Chitiniphilus sp. CD1]